VTEVLSSPRYDILQMNKAPKLNGFGTLFICRQSRETPCKKAGFHTPFKWELCHCGSGLQSLGSGNLFNDIGNGNNLFLKVQLPIFIKMSKEFVVQGMT